VSNTTSCLTNPPKYGHQVVSFDITLPQHYSVKILIFSPLLILLFPSASTPDIPFLRSPTTMSNKTDSSALQVHGTNPQHLISTSLRYKIYNVNYWLEECGELDPLTIIDKAMELKFIGIEIGSLKKPTEFVCLLLKLLQIQPSLRVILLYLQQEQNKYLRVLAAFYLRLVGKPYEVYKSLEPLYADYRKVRILDSYGDGVVLTTIDEIIHNLLTTNYAYSLQLPSLTKRWQLELDGVLRPRQSWLMINNQHVTLDSIPDIDMSPIDVVNPFYEEKMKKYQNDGDDGGEYNDDQNSHEVAPKKEEKLWRGVQTALLKKKYHKRAPQNSNKSTNHEFDDEKSVYNDGDDTNKAGFRGDHFKENNPRGSMKRKLVKLYNRFDILDGESSTNVSGPTISAVELRQRKLHQQQQLNLEEKRLKMVREKENLAKSEQEKRIQNDVKISPIPSSPIPLKTNMLSPTQLVVISQPSHCPTQQQQPPPQHSTQQPPPPPQLPQTPTTASKLAADLGLDEYSDSD